MQHAELSAGLTILRESLVPFDANRSTVDEASRYIEYLEGKDALVTKLETALNGWEEKGKFPEAVAELQALWNAHNAGK